MYLKTCCFLISIFTDFWFHFASQVDLVEAQKTDCWLLFSNMGAKRRPTAPQERPRAILGWILEPRGSILKRPGSVLEAPGPDFGGPGLNFGAPLWKKELKPRKRANGTLPQRNSTKHHIWAWDLIFYRHGGVFLGRGRGGEI